MVRSFFLLLNSLKFKFFIITTGLMIAFNIMIAYFWYHTTSTDAKNSAVANIKEMFNISNENFDVAVHDIKTILYQISLPSSSNKLFNILSRSDYSSSAELLKDNRDIDGIISNLTINKYYLSGLAIWDLNTKFYKTGVIMSFQEIENQQWFKDILNSHGEMVIIPPHYYSTYAQNSQFKDNNNMVISFAKLILNNNVPIGMVIADVRYELLNRIYNIKLKNKGKVYVINEKNNTLVYSLDSVTENDSKKIKTLANTVKKFTQDDGSLYLNLDDSDALIVYSRSSLTGWTAIGIIPVRNLMSNFYKAGSTASSITVIFCLFTAFTLFAVSTALTRNLIRLSNSVKNIDRNNLDFGIKIKTQDEIGYLAGQIHLMVERIKNLINDIRNSEMEKRKAEIRALQAQINPHFLYNSLNIIKSLSVLNGVESIKKVSESLSRLMYINMADRVFISVNDEIQYITSYLQILDYRFNGKLSFGIQVEDKIENLMIPKLLLQPIVENSIVHGLSKLKGKGIINIKIYSQNEDLIITVQDNGIGIKPDIINDIMNEKNKSDRIGLQNVISRIQLYFGETYGVSIISEANLFTVVELTIPKITEDQVMNYV